MMLPGWTLALTLLEPWGLLALLAPVILLVLGWSRDQAQEAYLGTARFFRADVQGDGGRRRRALPAWLVAAAASLVLAAIALARPGVPPAPPRGVAVELVVDRSPSMFLPVRAGLDPTTGDGRRIDAAFEFFRDWAAAYEEREGLQVLVRRADGSLTPWPEVVVPDPPRLAVAAPVWAAFDAPGVIWISDAEPAGGQRVHAGVFSSGGAAIPGPISMGPSGAVVWRAPGVVEFRAELGSERIVAIEPSVPPRVRELASVWADGRGLQVIERPRSEAVPRAELTILGLPREAPEEVMTDGAARTPWLLGEGGEALVAWGPGAIHCSFMAFPAPPDDEAAFAVSWIGLFDRARLAPDAVLAPAQRMAAGSPVQAPPVDLPIIGPTPPGTLADDATGISVAWEDPEGSRAALVRSLLAGGAAVLGLLAFVLVSGVTDRRRARRR